MTRVNTSIKPKMLSDQHLMAEYREAPMVPAALVRSLRTKSVASILKSIPKQATLNTGHVTFFFNKLGYLQDRYDRLVVELLDRGFNIDLDRKLISDERKSLIPSVFFESAYSENDKDRELLRVRIGEKLAQKPNWYRYHSNPLPDFLKSFYGLSK